MSEESTPSVHRSITLPSGFRAAGGTCGIKPSGKPDLTLIVADQLCSAAALFTQNRIPGAPVIVGKKHLAATQGQARAVLVNSGIANDATGQEGIDNAEQTAALLAQAISTGEQSISAEQVIPSSTGLIGPQIPVDKIADGIKQLVPKLARGAEADAAAAGGIMTTDLVPKQANRQIELDGKTVTLGGIAKGSGMIAPNLATMLVFITTDADVSAEVLQPMLKRACEISFNRISVDQHTSPSDTVLCLASGLAGNTPLSLADADVERDAMREVAGPAAIFQTALIDLCLDLAYQIVEDGEGATKVFRVIVDNAADEIEADKVGRCVIDSPLVKTAVHGQDPNWGRIVTAAGNSGVPLRPEQLSLHITGKGLAHETCVYDHGNPLMDKIGNDPRLAEAMACKEVIFRLDLGRGSTRVEWLGCDLSREYITINADYTT
jgi:glutamate N-acetyltransferase/amino-acid N-acetyltransferase